ncbi:MAG: hypothetical protein ACOZB3_00755 [Calditrichota bacterium]
MTEKQIKNIIRVVAGGISAVVLLTMPEVPLSKPLRDLIMPLTLIPVDEVIEQPEKPKIQPRPPALGPLSAQAMPAPYISPSDISAPPTQIVMAEPSMDKPEVGMVSEIFDRPPEKPDLVRMSPVASPLPDIITQRSDEGPAKPPPAALPGPTAQRGELYRGAGAPTLEVSTEPAYTGPDLRIPSGDLPNAGLTRGADVPGTPTPGIGPGDRYQSSAGTKPGADLAAGIAAQGDVVGEGELSGLLKWLRGQHADFPPVVRSYMETRSTDLLGVTSYAGWEIFVQFSEAEHQLKIFLTRGSSGILLADSDFKQRSQLFGLGRVTRDEKNIVSAIEAIREKPSRDRTDEFYRVFGSWMEAQGIKMGSRESK